MRSAVILAAGPDDRQPTASPGVDGAPPIREVFDRVAPAVEDVVISCPAHRTGAVESALEDADYRLAIDRVPDGGPIAAIRSGCRLARGRRTFVTAGEFPGVDDAFVDRLFDAVEDDGAVARIGGDRRPLVAVYDTDAAIDAAETTLGMGSRAATVFLDRLAVGSVPGPSARATDGGSDRRPAGSGSS